MRMAYAVRLFMGRMIGLLFHQRPLALSTLLMLLLMLHRRPWTRNYEESKRTFDYSLRLLLWNDISYSPLRFQSRLPISRPVFSFQGSFLATLRRPLPRRRSSQYPAEGPRRGLGYEGGRGIRRTIGFEIKRPEIAPWPLLPSLRLAPLAEPKLSR